jgi:hypothetical protein
MKNPDNMTTLRRFKLYNDKILHVMAEVRHTAQQS